MKIKEILLSALILLCAACRSSDQKPPLRTVRYEIIKVKKGEKLRTFSGKTRSGMESKLSFRVNGVLNSLNVKIGDKVRKGEVIAQLDPTDYALKVQEAEASLLQTKAKMRHASATYSRIRELYETRSASRNQLDAARAESESAEAAVESMNHKLALTFSELRYTTLKAPIKGTIAEVLVEENESISRGKPVVVLNSDTNIEAIVSVPEILIAEINKDDPVAVYFDILPEKPFKGIVSEVGVTSEVGTTFLVAIELLDSPKGVRSGMSAEVQFKFEQRDQLNRIFIRPDAVTGRGGENFVYIVRPDGENFGIIERRKVQVGSLTNAGIEVLQGISDGEYIVTAGWEKIKDGQRVNLQ